MKQKGLIVLAAMAVLLTVAIDLPAENDYKALNRPDRFYYGHISYIDTNAEGGDPVVLREGQKTPEVAVLNLPLGPGDLIRTTAKKRCEIQFDTATILRLDFDTELKIETILARSLSSVEEMSNLALMKGRVYVMYKEYAPKEVFQVLTPTSAVKMRHKTVAVIKAGADGATDVQVKYGKANVLFGPTADTLRREQVKKAERMIIQSDGQFQLAAYIADTDFETWNDGINKNFEDLHEGASVLPKAVQRLPRAVFYFAQKYGNLYGEWLWDDFYGYVWRPYLNNSTYPWGWQPYYYGSWASYGGQMFWVPEEPWGWIPYHLGIWQWDKKLGWVWLPGSIFAPAWADWYFFFGHFSWRPWSLWDWAWNPAMFADQSLVYGFDYRNGDWFYRWPAGGAASGRDFVGPASDRIRISQLNEGRPGALPLPREYKSVLKRVLSAYENGDDRAIESARQVPTGLVFVNQRDLNSRHVQEKVLKWEDVPRVKGIPPVREGQETSPAAKNPALQALRIFRGTDMVRDMVRRDDISGAVPGKVRIQEKSVAGSPGEEPPIQPAGMSAGLAGRRGPDRRTSSRSSRFLDWNPDVKVARRLGVSIEYSSLKNEISCPELRITSSDRSGQSRPYLSPRGSFPVSSDSSSAGNELSGSQEANPSRVSADPGSNSGTARGESAGAKSGKEKIKG